MYDALGNRVVRRSTNGSGTTLTTYAFGIEEHNYTGSGVNQSNQYYYALSGRLLGSSNGTSTTFFLTDALGSILASMSNTAGSAVINGNQDYGPYGNQLYTQGTIGTAKGFTGQYNDTLTGLDYYNARYYDPVIGRFLSADTVEGNMQGVDPYAYVSDNPETSNDPTGHCGGWWDVGCEAQQAWNQTTQVAQTIWNDGFVQPFNSTAHALQNAWNDGFVRPWNASVQAYQHMQDLVVKPLVSLATKIVIAVVVTVLIVAAVIAVIGHGAKSKNTGNIGRSEAKNINNHARRLWQDNGSNSSLNYGGGYVKLSNGKALYSYDGKGLKDHAFISKTDDHTEMQVLRWADGFISKNNVAKGSTITLVILTRNYPCGGCQDGIKGWADRYKAIGINVILAVWYLAPGKGGGILKQAMYINTQENIYTTYPER